MDPQTPLSVEHFLDDVESHVMFPQVGYEVTRMANDSRCSAIDIANTIAKDPFISAQVLRLANSPYYRFPSSVDTLTRAVSIIGTRDLCEMVLMLSTMGALTGNKYAHAGMEYIWKHSLFVGLLAKEISQFTDVRIMNKDRMFIVGVLHEIGRILFLQNDHENYAHLIAKEQQSTLPFYQLEFQMYGVFHADISSTLMTRWGFPKSLCSIIRFQNSLQQADEFRLETAILLVANHCSEEACLGSVGSDEELEQYRLARDVCQLEDDILAGAIEDARNMYFALLPSLIQKRA